MKPPVFEYEKMSTSQSEKIETIFATFNIIIPKEQLSIFNTALQPINQTPILAIMMCTMSAFAFLNYLIDNLDAMGAVLSDDAALTLQQVAELQRYLSGAIELMLVEEPVH